MPTYSYRCDACDHHFEAVQRFSDEPIRECPNCGGAVRRLIHPVGVVFKGSGWYVTDSRPKPKEDGKADDAKPGDKADKAAKTTEKADTAKATAD